MAVARTALLAFMFIAGHPANADFEAGQRAWDAGNVAEALSQWRDAATAGDRRAMLEIGRLYRQGLGVTQDYIEAHKWLNLAASRGEAEALEERDALATRMTPGQVATAQQRAAAWQPGETAGRTPQAGVPQPPTQALREAQALLATLGYDPGEADGVWGGRTTEAYRRFLDDAGLPAGDALTPDALSAMRALAGSRDTGAGAPPTAGAPRPAIRPDALHRAAQAGDSAGLKAALVAGADVNALDGQGWTALMHAVNKGYPQLVELLLEAKADPDIQAPDGATALFIAMVRKKTLVVGLLADAGADIQIRGPQGKTAVDVARVHGDSTLMQALGPVHGLVAELEMVAIPAGSFRMGDLSGDGYDDERPVHTVTVPAFRMGKYEVTVGQFRAFVDATGYSTDAEQKGCDSSGDWDSVSGRSWREPGYAVADEQSVVCVSWNDTRSFINWLNHKTGGNYRLPSEAEWEYAARAGSNTKYSWGDDISYNRANCDNDDCGDSWAHTAPVGSFLANTWGLHDMHGNVSEWVQDCGHGSYDDVPTDGSAWTWKSDGWTGRGCLGRVVRGGLGSAIRGVCVPPAAGGTVTRTATTVAASAWPRTSRTKV